MIKIMCYICKNDRCIGRYLLHPKEIVAIPIFKKAELKVCNKRTFKLCDSPSSGEIFIKFKELHVIAGSDEDISDIDKLPKVSIDISDIQKSIREHEYIMGQLWKI